MSSQEPIHFYFPGPIDHAAFARDVRAIGREIAKRRPPRTLRQRLRDAWRAFKR